MLMSKLHDKSPKTLQAMNVPVDIRVHRVLEKSLNLNVPYFDIFVNH